MRPRAGQRGVALVLVIWVLAVLAVLLSEFVWSGRVGLDAVRNQRLDAAGYYLALAGVGRAMEEIRRDFIGVQEGDEGGVLFVRAGEEAPAGEASTGRSGEIAGVGKYSYRIVDEESKINLNSFTRDQLVRFFRAAGVDLGTDRDVLVDSILDWRDANELHLLNGAESDYYRRLDPPYHAKNGRFDTAAELLLVRGMTRDLYFTPAEEGGAALADMISPYPTQCNYNTAPPAVLAGWVGETQARNFLARRPVTGSSGTSSHFTVEGVGWPTGAAAARRVRAVVRRESSTKGGRKSVTLKILEWDDLPSVRPPERHAAD